MNNRSEIYVDGNWISSSGSESIDVINPSTEEVIGSTPAGTKEDVDLAWRLQIYGWKSLYYPKAIAHHGRGTGVHRRFFNKELLKVRDRLSKFQKHHSFRNQHLMQAKNEFFINFLRDFFPIMGRKILMLIYITFKEPYLWKSYKEYLKLLPKILKKRKIIMKNKKTSAKKMRKYFKKQSNYLK